MIEYPDFNNEILRRQQSFMKTSKIELSKSGGSIDIASEFNETEYNNFKSETAQAFIQRYTKTEIAKAFGYPFERSDGYAFMFEDGIKEAFNRKSVSGIMYRGDDKGYSITPKQNLADNETNGFYYTADGTISTDVIIRSTFIDSGALKDPYMQVFNLNSNVNGGKRFAPTPNNNTGSKFFLYMYSSDSTGNFKRFKLGAWVFNDTTSGAVDVKIVVKENDGTLTSETFEVNGGECVFIEKVWEASDFSNYLVDAWIQKDNDSSSNIYIYGMTASRNPYTEILSPTNYTVEQLCQDTTIPPHIRGGSFEKSAPSTFAYSTTVGLFNTKSWKFTQGGSAIADRRLFFTIPDEFIDKSIVMTVCLYCPSANSSQQVQLGSDTCTACGSLITSTDTWEVGSYVLGQITSGRKFLLELVSGATNDVFYIGYIYFREIYTWSSDKVRLPSLYNLKQEGTSFFKVKMSDPLLESSSKLAEFKIVRGGAASQHIILYVYTTYVKIYIEDGTNNYSCQDTFNVAVGDELTIIVTFDIDTGTASIKVNERATVSVTATTWVSWTASSQTANIYKGFLLYQYVAYHSLFDSDEMTLLAEAGQVGIVQKNTISSTFKQTAEEILLKAADIFVNGWNFQDKKLYTENGKMIIDDTVNDERIYIDADEMAFFEKVASVWTRKATIGLPRGFAKYSTNAGQSISNNTATIVNFEDKIKDGLNEVTTGSSWKYKAKYEGVYIITVGVMFSTTTWTDGEVGSLQLFKNGSIEYFFVRNEIEASEDKFLCLSGTTLIFLDVDDEINVKVYQNTGFFLALYASTVYNQISIMRIY